MDETTSAQIAELVADALDLDVDEVREVDDLDVLEGWDSLRRLNVMMAIEETMDVTMSPDDLPNMSSVDRIARIVVERTTE